MKENTVLVENFSYTFCYVDSIHNTKHRYILDLKEYFKIQVDIAFECSAEVLTDLMNIKKEIKEFIVPSFSIHGSQHIIQDYFSTVDVREEKKMMSATIKFIYSHINKTLLSSQDLRIIQKDVKELTRQLQKIIGL